MSLIQWRTPALVFDLSNAFIIIKTLFWAASILKTISESAVVVGWWLPFCKLEIKYQGELWHRPRNGIVGKQITRACHLSSPFMVSLKLKKKLSIRQLFSFAR
jgi:hypothetical protein